MKYAFIHENAALFTLTIMCRVLGVSRSGYAGWLTRKPSPQAQERQAMDNKIRAAFERKRGREGSPRLTRALRKDGIAISENTVAERMKSMGLRAKAKKKFKATTNSKHNFPVSPNLLKRQFSVARPNQVWVTDITYLWTSVGWLYLAVILDLHSRRVVGWSMNERMTSTLVCDALRMAWFRRRRPEGVIVHSDRGSQYCGKDFQRLLKRYKMTSSMSRKGDCWDNAVAESFFHSIKVEAIHGENFETRESMREEVFEYIEVYYNRERLHSTRGYMSPAQFEQRKAA